MRTILRGLRESVTGSQPKGLGTRGQGSGARTHTLKPGYWLLHSFLAGTCLLSCHNAPEPCSPAAVLVMNEACTQAIAAALQSCPDGEMTVERCPEAQAVADGCRLVFRYQGARCSAE